MNEFGEGELEAIRDRLTGLSQQVEAQAAQLAFLRELTAGMIRGRTVSGKAKWGGFRVRGMARNVDSAGDVELITDQGTIEFIPINEVHLER